ncbi:MAG: DinB family protein [Bacteroidia bacterium]
MANTKQTRKNFYLLLKNLSLDQLNQIPSGFNNNLIWNFGHILVTQQLLCYRMANLEALLPDDFIDSYRKGSKPIGYIGANEWQKMKDFSRHSLDKMEEDLAQGKFKNYKEYSTSYGLTLKSIEDAINFNALHEAMHLGYAMALLRAVESNK